MTRDGPPEATDSPGGRPALGLRRGADARPRDTAPLRPGEPAPASGPGLGAFAVLGSLALVLAGLYWMRAVLVPIAVAILLTFLLAPIVASIERLGVRRVAAILVVVLLFLAVVGGLGWVLTRQLVTLAEELPGYGTHLRQKAADLRGMSKGGAIEKAQETLSEVVGEIQKGEPDEPDREPVAVTISSPPLLGLLPGVLEATATAGVTVVLVIFMLLERGELRDRVIRLFGHRRLTTTTRALDEAGTRITRYLTMQSTVNGSFGLLFGLGLLLIGVPYAALWGVLVAFLRFIPYLGVWIALSLPLILSLAVFPGWAQPAMILGLFLGLEVLAYVAIEPWLYGHSAGVSPVALLVAITFWTWVWGPVGLLLATPLTVCLLVLGKHLPPLAVFGLLLGDEPALDEKTRYYQRLLARDLDEAAGIVESHLARGAASVYDEVLLPGLYYAKQDRAHGRLTEREVERLVQSAGAILEEIEVDAPSPARGAGTGATPPPLALGWPAHDDIDGIALGMVRQGLDAGQVELRTRPGVLVAEVVADVDAERPAVVCIASVAPGGLSHARHLCKRLRARFPDLTIVVGRYGLHPELPAEGESLRAAGATAVGLTVRETQEILARWAALSPAAGAPSRDRPEGEMTAPPAPQPPALAPSSREGEAAAAPW